MTPDGQYGENTKNAVMLLETYVRSLKPIAMRSSGRHTIDEDADR